jgi:hypothetical protein
LIFFDINTGLLIFTVTGTKRENIVLFLQAVSYDHVLHVEYCICNLKAEFMLFDFSLLEIHIKVSSKMLHKMNASKLS